MTKVALFDTVAFLLDRNFSDVRWLWSLITAALEAEWRRNLTAKNDDDGGPFRHRAQLTLLQLRTVAVVLDHSADSGTRS
jgi:hypothetical protein